ncbi:helix-turn-helix domain-containing protein, partial [Microbulbifer epialgicus]
RRCFMIRRGARPSSNYLVVANSVVCDRRISFAASGLLLHLLSKPDHWEVSASALAKEAQEGRDKIYKLLNELIESGYCERITNRDEKGKMIGTDYEISDAPRDSQKLSNPLPENPDTDLPDTDNPDTANPDTDFPTQESKDTKKITTGERITTGESNQSESEGAQKRTPASTRKPKSPAKRGTRLPGDWTLTEEFRTEAQRVRPDLINRLHDIADEFRDYWVAQSGQRGVKADWLATWRNWLRRERSSTPKFKTAAQQRSERAAATYDYERATNF